MDPNAVLADLDDDQRRAEEFAKMRKFFGFHLGRSPDVDEFLDEPARFSSPAGWRVNARLGQCARNRPRCGAAASRMSD